MKTSNPWLPPKYTRSDRWSTFENNGDMFLRIFSEKNIHMTYRLTSSRDAEVFPGGREEVKANGRIIVLSPKLLEACKSAYAALDQIFLNQIPKPEDEAILNTLEDLIKKAEKG